MSKLKLLRIEAGLSQIELALASEVPRYVIQMAENGLRHPSPDQMAKLASCLGVSAKYLLPSNEAGAHTYG